MREDIEALVGPRFFFERDLGDSFDGRKGPVANFRAAMRVTRGEFWAGLASVTRAPTAGRHFRRAGVLCSPGELPELEIDKVSEAMPAMGAETPYDVLYAGPTAVPVRASPQADAATFHTLQNELVPMDPTLTGRLFKEGYWAIRLPDGRPGYVRTEDMYSLIDARLCFSKTDAGWRIVGFVGGGD